MNKRKTINKIEVLLQHELSLYTGKKCSTLLQCINKMVKVDSFKKCMFCRWIKLASASAIRHNRHNIKCRQLKKEKLTTLY